jgi:hypothetical protein
VEIPLGPIFTPPIGEEPEPVPGSTPPEPSFKEPVDKPNPPEKTPEDVLCHKHEYCTSHSDPQVYKVKKTKIETKFRNITKIVMETQKRTITVKEL